MSKGLFERVKDLVADGLARRLPDCKRMTRQFGDSLDRTPHWRDALLMKLHLFTCEACERYLEQITFLKKAMHSHGEAGAESRDEQALRLSAESKDRIRDILRGTVG